MSRHTLEEMETTIIWNAKDKTAKIWTADPFVMRRLNKKVSEHPDQYKCVLDDQKWGAKRYEVPKKLVRFSVPRTGHSPTQAQMKALEKAMASRQNKDKKKNEN